MFLSMNGDYTFVYFSEMEEFYSSSDEENNFDPVSYDLGESLAITKEATDQNYEGAGAEVSEEPDQLSLESNSHLLCDVVNHSIMELLNEIQLPYKLADFQLLSLHVLGSKKNLVLISPTGSGKVFNNFLLQCNPRLKQLFLQKFSKQKLHIRTRFCQI